MENSTERPDKWKIRRAIVVISLVFCASVITYLLVYGEDNRLSETLATGSFLLAGSVIGSYVFGAIWDDKNNPGSN